MSGAERSTAVAAVAVLGVTGGGVVGEGVSSGGGVARASQLISAGNSPTSKATEIARTIGLSSIRHKAGNVTV